MIKVAHWTTEGKLTIKGEIGLLNFKIWNVVHEYCSYTIFSPPSHAFLTSSLSSHQLPVVPHLVRGSLLSPSSSMLEFDWLHLVLALCRKPQLSCAHVYNRPDMFI